MGILNVTPDSFSDGGDHLDLEAATRRAVRMLEEGAQVVDVGGESTRPGSDPIPAGEEKRRVVPVIREIASNCCPDAMISIDTYHASTAEAALEAGARMVNDVTALRKDPEMASLVADAGCPVILMHMQGEPKTMQQKPSYEEVVREVRDFLAERADHAISAGIKPENIVLDPGIGFGKTLEHNLKLLKYLDAIVDLGFPVLVGTSRKGMFGKIPGAGSPENPKERLFGTVATNVMAYERGATFFRVHDVRENREALAVAEAVRGA